MKDEIIKDMLDSYYFGEKVKIKKEDLKTTYELSLKTGHGTMTCYDIFEGISLIYNDFHAFDCEEFLCEKKVSDTLIEINHCNKGRFECELEPGMLNYLGEGDLVASFAYHQKQISSFTLGYYEGLELLIDIPKAEKSISNFLNEEIKFNYLYELIKENNGIAIFRSNKEIDHVISELYNVDERIKMSYFKLKCVELLLFLKITNLERNKSISKNGFSLKHVNTIKMIKDELTENLNKDLTLNELSKKYNISKTTIKTCFKAIYGKPLFKWRKEYRLQHAEELLKNTDFKIAEIANKVGYKNSSKFTAAFKDYSGFTPSEYRTLKKY
ncbi:AraC family transcriptional regulator [Methanobrevibacter woesei]|uniref:helix-turn-helix domain-containing protein n=1 Tax=Methanobrevibacter woesei TaxID=190976 RepID=UPI0023F266A8|nr:helix-turn-helix domain-containing protein [Methanobrevibacter woesei]